MKKYFVLFGAILISTVALSQKVKMKNDIASVDGVPFLKFTTITFGSDYTLRHTDSEEEEISILYLNYKDPNQATNGNPEGKVSWIEVNFLIFNLKCEVDNRTRKAFAKLIYVSKIYLDGKINEEKVKKFVNKYGTRFSDNRPNGNTTIIINNN
jgi:hypothetical protein